MLNLRSSPSSIDESDVERQNYNDCQLLSLRAVCKNLPAIRNALQSVYNVIECLCHCTSRSMMHNVFMCVCDPNEIVRGNIVFMLSCTLHQYRYATHSVYDVLLKIRVQHGLRYEEKLIKLEAKVKARNPKKIDEIVNKAIDQLDYSCCGEDNALKILVVTDKMKHAIEANEHIMQRLRRSNIQVLALKDIEVCRVSQYVVRYR